MKNRIFIICIFIGLSSCVSQSKYSQALNDIEELESRIVALERQYYDMSMSVMARQDIPDYLKSTADYFVSEEQAREHVEEYFEERPEKYDLKKATVTRMGGNLFKVRYSVKLVESNHTLDAGSMLEVKPDGTYRMFTVGHNQAMPDN